MRVGPVASRAASDAGRARAVPARTSPLSAARLCANALAVSLLLHPHISHHHIGLLPPPAVARELTADQKLAAEAWKVTDREYVDRTFANQDWFSRRQKMVKKQYDSRADVYDEIRAMLASLDDKYTRFLTPAMYDALFSSATGDVAGIGVELSLEEAGGQDGTGRVAISSVVPDGPADKSGVLPDDVIVDVDGDSVAGLSAEEVAARVRGPPGSKLRLGLERPGKPEEVVLLIERAEVKLAAVTSSMSSAGGQKVGVIRIKQFSTSTAADVKAALDGLLPKKPQLLVLDLRGNAGGYFTGGVDVARLFLKKDSPITYVTDRTLAEVTYNTYDDGPDTQTPLIVLVDARTASASEILASALQDNGRAKLVGTRTFGKAVIQTVSKLSDGSGVVVTTARYETPKRTNINKLGIEVDVSKECPKKAPAEQCLP